MEDYYSGIPSIRSICIYKNIVKDNVVRSFIRLHERLKETDSPEKIIGSYSQFLGRLIDKTELSEGRIVGDAWKNHIMGLILEDENTFTRKAEFLAFSEISPGLVELAKHDLKAMQKAFDVSLLDISSAVGHSLKKKSWGFLIPNSAGPFRPLDTGNEDDAFSAAKDDFALASDWGECLSLLAGYARSCGCGIYGRYLAFRWVPGKGLAGIPNPDPVKLGDLISYERQREEVTANTRRFVQGYSANNVLLYGDRGTGKSSTVKALIHEFGKGGLRLVEVSRESFRDFPEILSLLSTRSQRFIIFIDDLSFEEFETEYKSLKAVLEGGIQAQPENVLIYATSNRKHLIKETFEDRTSPGVKRNGDVHPGDGLEEKISLADRFGLVVNFLRPDQRTYLTIVEGLAKKEGISLSVEELHSLALKWEMLHNGRSGRTAKQFIQDLIGRTRMLEGE